MPNSDIFILQVLMFHIITLLAFYLSLLNCYAATETSARNAIDAFFDDLPSAAQNLAMPQDDENRTIEVKRRVGELDSVLFANFAVNHPSLNNTAGKIVEDVANLFRKNRNIHPVLQREIANLKLPSKIDDFEMLKTKGIDYVVTGTLDLVKDDSLESFKIHLSIWDVYEKANILEHEFIGSTAKLESFTKEFATQIYEFITGDFGFFYGKLLYTWRDLSRQKIFKRVIFSHDDEKQINVTAITDGKSIAFNPRYCKAKKELMYVLQKRGRAGEIFISSTITGIREKVDISSFKKVKKSLFAPSFSNDCNKIIFSIAEENGYINVYLLERNTNIIRKLTNLGTINTSAKFFDNNSKIIFISDRSGKPQIFVVNLDGTLQEHVSKNSGSYFSPSVSNDGKRIVFSKLQSGMFKLSVADIDGENEKDLLSGFLIENPVWAPIGKTIIFSMKQNRHSKSRIYSISENTLTLKELPALSGDLNEPMWIDEQ